MYRLLALCSFELNQILVSVKHALFIEVEYRQYLVFNIVIGKC